MRHYSVAISALAIGAPTKWLDNILSHHHVPNVTLARRGVARRIPRPALSLLALTRELHATLGLGVREALGIAESLLDPQGGAVHRSGHLTVACDRVALERDIDVRLRDALESAPTPRRGRPPARRRRAGDRRPDATEPME